MMRILLDCKEMVAGGTGLARYEREVARRITSRLDCVTIVRKNARRDGSAAALGGRVVTLPDRLPSLIIEQLVTPVLALVFHADVVHCLAGQAPLLPVRGLVVTFHEDRDAYYRLHPPVGIYARLAALSQVWTCLRSLKRARVVLAVSEASAAVAVRMSGRDHSSVLAIPHGVSESFRRPIPSRGFGRYVLLIVGADPRDDVEFALTAMGPLRDRLTAVLVGEVAAETKARVAATAHREDLTVALVGRVSDEELAGLYGGAFCYVHPSDYEGFGLAIAEAMASGTVVLARPSPAVEEVAGDCAICVDSPAELTEALKTLLADSHLRDVLVERGAERVTRFNWDDVCRATIEAYSQ